MTTTKQIRAMLFTTPAAELVRVRRALDADAVRLLKACPDGAAARGTVEMMIAIDDELAARRGWAL